MTTTESTQTHSTRRAAANSRRSRRAAAPQITVESARALLGRIARLRAQAEQLQSDLEALRDELPEGEIGPIDNRNYLVEVRQKVQSCLTDLEGPVSLLQPDEDDAECVLRSLEQLVGAERRAARVSRAGAGASIDSTPASSTGCGDLPPRADLARHLEEQNQALINACAVVAIAQGQITAAQNEREDVSVGEDAAALIRQSLGLVQTALEGVAEQLEPIVALDRLREDAA